MIQYMRANYRVDPNRIFITGLSAGAAMAIVMMATHPEMFNAGAIFAGAAYKLSTNVFSSAAVMAGTKNLTRTELVRKVEEQNLDYKGKYPSIIIYQGLNDPVVHHKNAGLLIEQWTGIHHCDAVPDKTEMSYMNISDIKRMEFHDSSGNTVVTYYEINHLGHRVLVKPGNAKNEGGETGMYGMNKNFHSTYQTAKEFGIIRE
jgi:poly(3-hydroxybutyrate) depolymerase